MKISFILEQKIHSEIQPKMCSEIRFFCFKTIFLKRIELKLIQCKGQLISKFLFGVFTFFQKTSENKSTSSKVEFVHSFFGRNICLKIKFRICQTFNILHRLQRAKRRLPRFSNLYLCNLSNIYQNSQKSVFCFKLIFKGTTDGNELKLIQANFLRRLQGVKRRLYWRQGNNGKIHTFFDFLA